jgi:hypothetical protein
MEEVKKDRRPMKQVYELRNEESRTRSHVYGSGKPNHRQKRQGRTIMDLFANGLARREIDRDITRKSQ